MIRKRRVTKTVIILTVTFMLLWFPVHFLATWYRLDSNFPEGFVLYVLKMVALTMAYSNASVNPIIYAFSNESVRITLSSMFSCCECLKANLNVNAGGGVGGATTANATTFRFDLVPGNDGAVLSAAINGGGGSNPNELSVKQRNRILKNDEGDFASAVDCVALRQIEDDLSGNLL